MESSDDSSIIVEDEESSYTSDISDETEIINELYQEEPGEKRLKDWDERFKRFEELDKTPGLDKVYDIRNEEDLESYVLDVDKTESMDDGEPYEEKHLQNMGNSSVTRNQHISYEQKYQNLTNTSLIERLQNQDLGSPKNLSPNKTYLSNGELNSYNTSSRASGFPVIAPERPIPEQHLSPARNTKMINENTSYVLPKGHIIKGHLQPVTTSEIMIENTGTNATRRSKIRYMTGRPLHLIRQSSQEEETNSEYSLEDHHLGPMLEARLNSSTASTLKPKKRFTLKGSSKKK